MLIKPFTLINANSIAIGCLNIVHDIAHVNHRLLFSMFSYLSAGHWYPRTLFTDGAIGRGIR
jgi:hypothetical protein